MPRLAFIAVPAFVTLASADAQTPAASIAGQVLDAATGAPIAGARLALSGRTAVTTTSALDPIRWTV
jgi:hypothetical protein